MSKPPKMPVLRRSSVTSAKPFLIASTGEWLSTSLPCTRTSPPCFSRMPNSVSTISVRFAPTKPPMPNTSPWRNSKLTSWMEGWFFAVKWLTCKTTSPGVLVFSGKRCVKLRPTILATNSSILVWATCSVSIHLPSRKMVISSQILKISSILCEI